jgi:hypothetical protein
MKNQSLSINKMDLICRTKVKAKALNVAKSNPILEFLQTLLLKLRRESLITYTPIEATEILICVRLHNTDQSRDTAKLPPVHAQTPKATANQT